MTRHIRVGFLVAAAFLLAGNASAQSASSGAIAGEVRDTTGAVLPGVTVEAASPALIEKVRTVLTDSQGQYKIVELRPGAYTVTFGLSGFSTLRRENIQLTAGFTATVNADMRLGALEETVTVSGATRLSTPRRCDRRTCFPARFSTRCRAAGRSTATRRLRLVPMRPSRAGDRMWAEPSAMLTAPSRSTAAGPQMASCSSTA